MKRSFQLSVQNYGSRATIVCTTFVSMFLSFSVSKEKLRIWKGNGKELILEIGGEVYVKVPLGLS